MSVSIPLGSVPAGITMLAVPALSLVEAEVYDPLVSVTVPGGVLVLDTVMLTVSGCVDEIVDADGLTTTVGTRKLTAIVWLAAGVVCPRPTLLVARLKIE